MKSTATRMRRSMCATSLILLLRSVAFAEAAAPKELKSDSRSAERRDESGAAVGVNYLARIPPVVVTPLPSVTSPVGNSVRFALEIRGSAPFNIQWLKNGIKIPGATSATLVIPDVREGDGGRYHAVVTNLAGSTLTNLATLTVTDAVAAPSNAKVAISIN